MDEKRKLKVLDKVETAVDETVEEKPAQKVSNPHQSNPIYKNLAKFINAKVGDKLSIKDFLR